MSAMTAEAEVTAVHAPGTDLAAYQARAVEEYRPRIIMAADEASELDKSLRDMMKAVLRDNVDFGVIPGTGSKPTLLKPGAEKLLQWFGFGHETEKVETERDAAGARIGVTYRCTVTKAMPDGRVVTVATCEGYAGYDEDRFYISEQAAKAKAEANERKWAAKDKRQPNSAKWENAAEYRAPWNSVIKMSQKRALVGAALQATSASTLFTQDLEDMRDSAVDGGQFAAAAQAAVMDLPDEIRAALDAWYRSRKWPDPGRWTAEQWCAALMEAGALAARAGGAQAAPQDAGTQVPPATAPASSGWLDAALAKAPGLPTIKTCQELWRESAAKVSAGEIAKADAKRVQEILRARMEDLRQEAQASAALDPEDPWSVKVESLASSQDAAPVVAEVIRLYHGGHIGAERRDALIAAITARFPGAVTETAAAA